MYTLQTTTTVLIAFLAVLAYSQVRNRLAKSRTSRKDLETLSSPGTPITNDAKPPVSNDDVANLFVPREEELVNGETEKHKQLYYKLHNLEHHPEILPECRQLLLSLLSSTLNDAFQEPDSGILSVSNFSRNALNAFLKTKDVDVTNRWEEYLTRRKAGRPREIFTEKEEAEWWLKQAAPIKYVDGAWLGHINTITTPFKYRRVTKNAWQVMSEELGDGHLAKNHVHVYRELMEEINAGLPDADSEDFIHARHELNEARCWKAALAQLLISLFPHEFLPEALGFNMAYESLPLHLLKTVKELRELRLNPYYFELHISIDNADSGHAAMAMAAVTSYIDIIAQDEGEEAAHVAWKRVQAGYILAEGLPTTPQSSSLKQECEAPFPNSKTEAALIAIFSAKCAVAHKLHCTSRLCIGGRSLVDWLEPVAFSRLQWQKDFLHNLSYCKPWVIKGSSEKSRLVKELIWGGRMFGSFTEKEVDVVRAWIDELGQTSRPDGKVYYDFTRRSPAPIKTTRELDILTDYPVLSTPDVTTTLLLSSTIAADTGIFDNTLLLNLNLTNFLPLWFASPALLQSFPCVPVRAASPSGSALICVLRAQSGFSDEGPGVAGMDEVVRTDTGQAIGIVELGMEMCARASQTEPKDLREIVALGDEETGEYVRQMLDLSMRWFTNRDVLVGMSWAWMEMHEVIAELNGDATFLSEEGRRILGDIARRERRGLTAYCEEIEQDASRKEEVCKGVAILRGIVAKCYME
ncbi:hypothetical protein EJ02DRAFT_456287 [Clathrospora elynae]|uniref:Heme oxygenase-like protein n=1 Tax=Clathrospora elynae TaxID=706981 RepID=A0A6A5SKE0_9PLEO|nr:hypothetical protein EJ02DRAFT_456287 [Clathrospora elynae]